MCPVGGKRSKRVKHSKRESNRLNRAQRRELKPHRFPPPRASARSQEADQHRCRVLAQFINDDLPPLAAVFCTRKRRPHVARAKGMSAHAVGRRNRVHVRAFNPRRRPPLRRRRRSLTPLRRGKRTCRRLRLRRGSQSRGSWHRRGGSCRFFLCGRDGQHGRRERRYLLHREAVVPLMGRAAPCTLRNS